MAVSLDHYRRVLREQIIESSEGPLPQLTERRLAGRVRFPGKATAVVGARRAGKTTFLHQLRQAHADGGVPRASLPYISFEDERLAGFEARYLGMLEEEFARLSPRVEHDAPTAWFLDELQLVPGWERFVRRLLDSGRAEVCVSGSSAALLSREISSSLRGRSWQVLIHPFGFEEVLRHRGLSGSERLGAMDRRERLHVERAFLDWLETGGFPEAQGLNRMSRHQLLQEYVDVAMFRDVIERHQVRNVTGLRWLVRHLLGNAGSKFSVEKFHAALKSQGLAIARDTVHQLVSHLEDCFLVRVVWMESRSERQRMVNPRKTYPVDSGLIRVFDRSGRANLGHALETAVLLELERRRFHVTYVRTPEGYEVDFLARRPDGEEHLIQVCADISEPATARREFQALEAAGTLFPQARKTVLTLTHDPYGETPSGVDVRPTYEWALDRTSEGEMSPL